MSSVCTSYLCVLSCVGTAYVHGSSREKAPIDEGRKNNNSEDRWRSIDTQAR